MSQYREVTPAEWVAALESDEWTPATGDLVAYNADGDRVDPTRHEPIGHCCLGVLARLTGFTDEQCAGGGSLWPTASIDFGDHEPHNQRWVDRGNDGPPPPEWLTAADADEFAELNDHNIEYPIKAIRKRYGLD